MTTKRPEVLRGTRRLDSRRLIATTAESAANAVIPSLLDEVDWESLDRSEFAEWITELADGERAIRALRLRLEDLRQDVRRRCQSCGQPFTGRADRRFCGATCRQRASRASRLES